MVVARNGAFMRVLASNLFGSIGGAANVAVVIWFFEKALDLELALMLEAYRRRTRELSLRQDAMILAGWAYIEDELGTTDNGTCDLCGEPYDEGGDGYAGLCPECADATQQITGTPSSAAALK
jgi:hypothetical protein